MWAIGVALALAAGLAGYFISHDRATPERLLREMDERRAAEQALQAELRAVRKRAEEVEQALIDAEQVAAQGRKPEQPRPGPVLQVPEPREARVAQAKQAAVARRQASERALQDERERRRADEAAAANRPVALPAPPPPPPAPRAVEPVQEARVSPEHICRAESNFITRAVCETRECIKPDNIGTAWCKSLRARASPAGQ